MSVGGGGGGGGGTAPSAKAFQLNADRTGSWAQGEFAAQLALMVERREAAVTYASDVGVKYELITTLQPSDNVAVPSAVVGVEMLIACPFTRAYVDSDVENS